MAEKSEWVNSLDQKIRATLVATFTMALPPVPRFRPAFRAWAGDETQFPREVAEAALAHAVGDETER
jgi:hypothetical protein